MDGTETPGMYTCRTQYLNRTSAGWLLVLREDSPRPATPGPGSQFRLFSSFWQLFQRFLRIFRPPLSSAPVLLPSSCPCISVELGNPSTRGMPIPPRPSAVIYHSPLAHSRALHRICSGQTSSGSPSLTDKDVLLQPPELACQPPVYKAEGSWQAAVPALS